MNTLLNTWIMPQKLDIVLFGASGFTGKHAIPFIDKYSKTNTKQLTWGIAGRSEEKLKSALKDYEKETGISLNNVPIIIADVNEEESLRKMVRKARIIINCCGPFHFYGEQVVKACVEEGVHLVDVSAEVQYIEKMQLKYHKQAEEKEVYIISACGLESLPTDLGIVFLQQNFEGTLNSVEAYLEYWEEGNQPKVGSIINYTSWLGMVPLLTSGKEIKKIRKELFSKQLPIFEPQLKQKWFPHKTDLMKGWTFPFQLSDYSVVKRSQHFFYEQNSKRPVQIETYFVTKSFLVLLLFCFMGLILTILSKFHFGQKLILKYPELISLGNITKWLPNEERIDNSYFKITFYAEGWKDKLLEANDKYTLPPNKAVTAEMKGPRPAYGVTNICLVLAAITLITETDKLPSRGGVYPPGYAFANTSLVNQLKGNDINMKLLHEKDL